MSQENTVMRQIWLALGRTSILFRLNSGTGWVTGGGPVTKEPDGSARVPFGRPVPLGFGMPNSKPKAGVGDLVGWTTIEITPDMIGSRVAVFTSIETKSSEDAEKREQQRIFIRELQAAGGITGFAHSPEMAAQIVRGYCPIRSKA